MKIAWEGKNLLKEIKKGTYSVRQVAETVIRAKKKYPDEYRTIIELPRQYFPPLEQYDELPECVRWLLDNCKLSIYLLQYWATTAIPEVKDNYLKSIITGLSLEESNPLTWGEIERKYVYTTAYKLPKADFVFGIAEQIRRSLLSVGWDRDKKDAPKGTPACNGCPHNLIAGGNRMCYNVACFEKKEAHHATEEIAELRKTVSLKIIDPFEFDVTGNSRKVFTNHLLKIALALAETGENRFPELPEYQNLLAIKSKPKNIRSTLVDSMRYYLERLRGDDLWVFAARLCPESLEGI